MTDRPPVSLLKPLCGLEPNIEANLESFFAQDYPRFEIVFGTHSEQDPALAVARALQARYPQVPVKFTFSGEPDRPNAKVCSLEKMVSAASFDYLVISDSDVHVQANYITEVVRPLADEQVGLVTCLYRGVPTSGIWSRLEAIGMSVEMTAGVIVANLLEGMRFALGPTMALRRQVLAEIGGIGTLADYHADDYVLGERVYESGRRVVLSSHVIDHLALRQCFRDSAAHQVRWMKSTRFSRPKGHLGTALTFAVPFGLLGLFAGLASGHVILGLCLFGCGGAQPHDHVGSGRLGSGPRPPLAARLLAISHTRPDGLLLLDRQLHGVHRRLAASDAIACFPVVACCMCQSPPQLCRLNLYNRQRSPGWTHNPLSQRQPSPGTPPARGVHSRASCARTQIFYLYLSCPPTSGKFRLPLDGFPGKSRYLRCCISRFRRRVSSNGGLRVRLLHKMKTVPL